MTSTNDGKDVKSIQASGQKGKSYYVELYKSLDGRLSGECELSDRTQHLCEAWRRVHSLCQHSAPTTHPHLVAWLQRHTARTILQTEWQSPKSKDEHTHLTEAIDSFIAECAAATEARNGVSPPWESQLRLRGEWFKKILANPWGHPVLRILLDPRGQQPTDDEILEWLKEERGVMFVTRLRQLAASKCDDLAMSLVTAVMDRVRATATLLPDAEQGDTRDKPACAEGAFALVLRTEAGFTVEVWELVTDIEFVLLHKADRMSKCIELAKQTALRDGYQLAERLQSRLENSPREKKLWKNAKEVATLIAQVIVARCMVVPICAGVARTALYCCARSLARLVPRTRLPAAAASLAAPAATARHLHTLAAAYDAQAKYGPCCATCARSIARLVPRTRLPAAAASLAAPAATDRHLHTLAAAYDAQCSSDMKPFVCELYVRAITAGMNELERLKLKTEKNSEARSAEQTLCTWFTQLGALLSASDRIKCECTLTAFSVHPSPAMYDRIKNAPTLPPVTVDDQDIKQETTSEFGSWATDSRTQTNLVKTSETLNIKQTQQQNVLSTAILTEGEGLGLSPELCMDLAVLLSGPRLKTLSWDMDRELLLDNCRTYLERTHGGTRALTTELKYLNLDPSSYQHLPEEDDDDENNAYYGIEKGYEHLVEIQEQDQLSPNAMFDYERTDTAASDIEIAPTTSRRKKKTKKIVFSTDEETDPLSLVAETKKEKKKERPLSKERSKERPLSKERSKERPLSKERSKDRSASKEKKERKKKTKSTGDSTENKEKSRERRKESGDSKQKKDAKEKKPRKKKTKEILPVECKSGSLSSLIGMKVAKVPAPDGKQKIPETKPAASVTDSDYDSQGKSSLASLNSDGNGPDVLFDGLFTDEYRSPDKADPLSERRSSFPNSEVSFAHGQMAINYQKSKANSKSSLKMPYPQTKPAQAVATVTSTPSSPKIPDEVKKRISGLLEYRAQKNLFEQAQRLSPFHTPPPPTPPPAMPPPPSPHRSPATPIKSPNAIIQPIYPEQQIISPKAVEVPEIPKVYINKKQMDQIKVIREEVDVYLKSKFASKPVIQYASKLTNDSPQSTTQNECLNLSTHQQDSRFPGPSQEQTKSAVSVLYEQNTSVKQTGLSFHESYEKSLQDFLRELRETTNAGTGKCKNKTATNINKNIQTEKEIKKEAKPSSRVSNVSSKVESTPSQCAKLNNQGKKVETQLNTFARRSYMHKNKQNLESVNLEMTINRCLEEQKLAKLMSLQCSNVIISRTCNSTNLQKTNTDNDLVIRKVEKTNVPQEHSLLMNILHGKANTSTETSVKNISLQPVKRKSTSTPKYLTESALSEKDQNELLNLLRQQNKLNTHPAPAVNTDFTNVKKIVNNPQCLKINTATSSNYNMIVNKNVTVIKNHPIETCNDMYNIIQNYENFKDRKTSEPTQKMLYPNATDCKTANINVPITSKNVDSLDNGSLNTYHNKIESKHKEDQIKSYIAKADANGKNWQEVMNALLSHKTPSRGPSALDMVLKKDSQADKNLRNQRIVRPNTINETRTEHRVSNEKDKKQASTASHIPNAHSHQQMVSNEKDKKQAITASHIPNVHSHQQMASNEKDKKQAITASHIPNAHSHQQMASNEKDKKQAITASHIPNAHSHQPIQSSIPSVVATHSTNINLARLQQPSKLIESLPKKQSANLKNEGDRITKRCNQNATNKLLKKVCPQRSPVMPSSKQKTKNKRKQAISQNIAQPSCTQDEINRKDILVHQNIVKKVLNVEKPKRITTVKKPCTTGIIQEKDPFISGISNSDYDLLEELMDDELRKEIGELSSDEETYKIQTNSVKCTKIPNSTSCINVIKNAPIQQVKSNVPYTSSAPQSCRESIIQTSQIHAPCQNNPKVMSDIKLNNVALNQIVGLNVKQYSKDCKTTDFVASIPPACPTIIHQPLNTNVINKNIEQPPLVSRSHTNVVDPRNVIITTIPQRPLQNVVLINSELVYDPYAALQTNVTNLHTGISNVNQTPYVTFENTANLTVFQTTQFAAPLVKPFIIGNAITAQASPASMQEVPLDTSVAQSNEVDGSRNTHGLLELQERLPKTNQHNNNIPSKPETQAYNVSPHSNNKGLLTSQECRQGAKTENVEVLKPVNITSDVAEKDNNTDKLARDQKTLQRPTEINSISIEPSSKTCERKVLKEVQEKQKLNLHSSMQKTTIENDNKNIDKELETNVHESTSKETKQSVEELLSKERRKEIERLKRKRLRILSRVVNNRTNKPPIPLSYTPLVQKDISKEPPKETKRLDETKHNNSSSECPNKMSERHTDSSKENDSNVSTRRILLRSSNVIQSNVPDDKTTKSHIKKTKTERKDETRLPSKDSLLSAQEVGKGKQSDNDHSKIPKTPDKLSEIILKFKTAEKPKKVAKLILKIPKKPLVSNRKGSNKKSPKRLENKNKGSKRSSKAKKIDTNLNFIDIEEALVGAKIEKTVLSLKNSKEIANAAASKNDEIHGPVKSMSVEPLNRNLDSGTKNVTKKEGTLNKSKEKTPRLRVKRNSGNTAKPLHSNLNTMAHNAHAESVVIASSTTLLKTPGNESDSISEFVKSVPAPADSSKLRDKLVLHTPGGKAKEEIVSIQKPCRIIPQKEKQSESYVPTSVIRKGINQIGYKGMSFNKNSGSNEHNQRSSPTVSNKILNCPKNELSVSNNNLLPNKKVAESRKPDICQDKNTLHKSFNKNSDNNEHNQRSSSPTVSNKLLNCPKNELSVSSNNNLLPNKKVAEPSKPDICEDKNTLHNSLNYLKDKVTIEELPDEGQSGNPDKKCVRIKLPNGKSFKATVYGKMHVSFESLFSDPSLKNALISNLNTSRRYTLNIKQVSTQLIADPSKIVGARIEEINLQPKGDAIETVDLLSDEEEGNNNENIFTNRTEFDGYKILSPSEQLFEQHRTKLTQKCSVKLVRTKIKSKEAEKHPEMAPVIEIRSVFKNTPLNERAIFDIDSMMADKVKVIQSKPEEVVNNAEVTPVIDFNSVAVNSPLNEEVFVDIDSVLTENLSIIADKVKVIQTKSEEVVNNAEITPFMDLKSVVVNAPLNNEVFANIDSVLADKVKVIQSKSEEVVSNANITPVIDLNSVAVNSTLNEEIHVDTDSVLTNKVSIITDKVKVIQSKCEEVLNNAEITPVIDLNSVAVNSPLNEEINVDIDSVLTNNVSIMTDTVKLIQSKCEEVVNNAEITPFINLESVVVNAPSKNEVFVDIDSVLADEVKEIQSKSEDVVNNVEIAPVIDLTSVVVNFPLNEEVHGDIDSASTNKVSIMADKVKVIQSKSEEVVNNAEITPFMNLKSVVVNAPLNNEVFVNIDSVLADKVKVIQSKSEEVVNNAEMRPVIDLTGVVVNVPLNEEVDVDIDSVLTKKVSIMAYTDKTSEEVVNNAEITPSMDLKSVVVNAALNNEVFVKIDSVLADKVKVIQSKNEEAVNNAEITPVIDLTDVVVNAPLNEEVDVDIDSVLADKVSKMEELKVIQIDNSLNDAQECLVNLFPSETQSEKVAGNDEIAPVVDLISRAKNTEEDEVIEIDDSSNDSLDLFQDFAISPGRKLGGGYAKPGEKINELKNLLLKDLGVEENQEASDPITIDSLSCISDDSNSEYVPIIKQCAVSLSRCDELVKKYDQAKIINNQCIVKLVRCDDMIKTRNEDYHNKNLLASDEFIDAGFEDDNQSESCVLSRSGSFSILNEFMFYDQEEIDESPNGSFDRNISSPVMDVFETIVALKKYSHVDKGRLGFLTETIHPLPGSSEKEETPNSSFDRNISSPVMDVFETIVALKKYSHVDKNRIGFLTETIHPLPCSSEKEESPNSSFERDLSSPVMGVFETIVALKKYSHVEKGKVGFLTKTDHPLPCSFEKDESPNSFDRGRSSPVMDVFETIVALKKYSHVEKARHGFLIKTDHRLPCSSEWYKTKRETNLESKSVEIVFVKSDKHCLDLNKKSYLPKIPILNETPTLKTLTANYFSDSTILDNYIMCGPQKAIYGITKKDAIESTTYKLKRKFKSCEFKSTDCKILRTMDNTTHNIKIDRSKPYNDDNNESSVVPSSIFEIDKDMSICALSEDYIQNANLSTNSEEIDNKLSSKLTEIACCDEAKDIKGISLTETTYIEQPFYLTSELSENHTLLNQNEIAHTTADTSDIIQDVDRVKAELNGRRCTKRYLNTSVIEDLEQNEVIAIELPQNIDLKKINEDQLPITNQQPIECLRTAELVNDSEQHKVYVENNSMDAKIHNTLPHPIAIVSTISKEQSEMSKDKADVLSDIDIINEFNNDMDLTGRKSFTTLLNLDENNTVSMTEDSSQKSPEVELNIIQNIQSGVILEEKDEKFTRSLQKVKLVDELNTIQNVQLDVTLEEINEIDEHFNTTNEYDKDSTEKDSMKNSLHFDENSTVNINEHSPQNIRSDVIPKYPVIVNQLNKEITENNYTEILIDSTIDISINNTKHRQDCTESNCANCDVNALEIEISCLEKSKIIDQTVPDLIRQQLVVTDDKCTTFNLSCEAITKETVNLFHDLKNDENADVETPMLSIAENTDENEKQCVDLVCTNKLIQCPTLELLDHEYASPIIKINNSPTCSEENLQSNLPADEIAEELTEFETSIEDTYLDTLEEKLKNLERKEVTLVCKDRDDIVLTGIEYEDPVVGTCYVFPIIEETDDAEELIEVVQEIDDSEIIDTEESGLYDEYILEVNIPKVTYTRLKKRCTALKKFKLNNLKRKSDMNDEIYAGKRYRLEKKINHHPRGVTPANFVFGKEYKRVIDYCNSIKFSFSHPFVKDIIDVEAMLTNWPIKGVCANSDSISDNDESVKLFRDDDKPHSNPTDEPFIDEISKNYNDLDPHLDTIDESNFNMGFGEGSDRVIQNLEEDGDDSKFSAATLSDVKQPQPFWLSEENDTKKELDAQEKHSDDQLKKLKHYITYIQLRDKVRSFFQKTSVELSMGFNNQEKELSFNNKFSMKHTINSLFDLCLPDFIEPSPIEAVVQVVQIGQLPVSAAAQNPVTCDPRVTQVSDASPSQCSVDNSPQDDSQVTIKTEYTELTTADLTLPLVQEYAQHNQNLPLESENAPNMHMSNENIPIETEIKSVVKIELEELPDDVKEENRESLDNNEFQSDENKNDNNVEFSFESNNTGNTSNLDSDSDFQNLFNASDKQSDNETYIQKQQNGTSEKTDQIAHAMNAAGITTSTETMTSATRTHALVNILSQKLRQGAIGAAQSATNTYPKTTAINAMALQQALAQILPPPLNQTNVSDNNQQSSNTQVTPQVLHIVQGKNATGSQITLVDNSQQSVINNPNATPVLHIVQNKSGTNCANSNGTATPQANSFSGLSLVDAGLQQGGNQLLHIVNTGTQKNNNATGQLLKRVNLLTNLANVQGSNEQKMVQFVCKSADGKSIQLNAPHQRSMVLRLQPIETPNVTVQATPKSSDNQDGSTNSSTNSLAGKDSNSQQEIKSRSVYEENYAKFIQNSSNKSTVSEKSTSLPKFNQAFGKPVFQDGNQKSEINSNSSHLTSVNNNNDTNECQSNDNAMNLDHISQISSPPLLLRKSPQTSQSQANLVQQLKQTIAPMNIQTMHGGVIYTRQIPVNIGGGQTINLITVPSTELIDDSGQKQQSGTQNEMEQSIIKIVPQTQNNSNTDLSTDENNAPISGSNENTQTAQPQQVLTQMRIKLPMLSKAPQMVSGARVVRPSFFQIQRNVIGGANQPVYQQLVLTAAPPLGQQTIRLPQTQTSRPIKVPSENQSSAESQMSSSTLEQLREFDMVLEQVKERSTVQPGASASATFPKLHTPSTDTTDSTSASSTSTESTQQVLYSIGNNQPLNVAYVNRKATVTTPTTSSFVRSPDSSGIVDSPTSSTHVQISHTVTSETTQNESPTQPKPAKVSSKSKSRPKASSNPPNTLKLNTVPPKTSAQKPLEDEQTTQRILYILAEYKEQVENSPDKDKPAPRRRSNPPSNPGSSKRKKSSSGSRRHGARDLSPVHGEDTCRTMGSEDSSCGTSQGDCNESCLESHSPQDSPRKVVRKLTFEQETPTTPLPRPQPQRNVIVADGQTITVARGTAGKPATAVLMPANYILPVSMVKGGQQIAIVTNRGPKLLTVGGGEGGATNALLLQRLIGPAGLKPVLARPGVRHVRLPTAALHNLQAFNLATTTTIQPPDSTASPAPAPTPPELVDTRANSSPWTDRDIQDVKPERASSPEGSEPWNLPSSGDPHDYSYEETVRADNLDRTVLDPIPDRYSPDMEAQRIFDKMFDVESKKSYMGDSHDDSPRCGYDIDASDCDDKAYHQVVQKKDGSSHRQHRLTHVSAAALRHKYAILEHELRLQKSLSEECEDLGVDSPSASELFPEAELLFAASPAHDHTQDHGHHSHTPQPNLNQSCIPQPDMDDQIATDQLLSRSDMSTSTHQLSLGLGESIVAVSQDGMPPTITLDHEEFARAHPNTTFHSEPTDGELSLGLGEGIVAVSQDGMPPTISLDHEEFARAHPNTTFYSEPTDGEVQPFTIAGIKGRHITSTIFHSNRAPATVLMTTPQTTVISQATADNTVKYDIDNMINSLPSANNSNINLASVLVKDDGLTRFDNILSDTRELHLSNTASAIVHSAGNAAQVIRRVCYDEDKRDNRFLMDEPDALIAGDDAKMIAEDSSRDATMESMPGDVDDDRSSPERHAELFWESNSASASESRRPLDFSSDSEKCCKSPSYDETNSTDSSGVGTHMRLDSVIKEARGIERTGSADGSSADDTHPPLRTYPPKRMYHPLEGDVERSLSGKTRAGERSPDSIEVRRRASGRGVVKRGCHCCNGSPAPPRPKKSRQRKPTMDFNTN